MLVQARVSTEPDSNHGAGTLTACRALFAQLPWEDIAQLDADSIRTGVQTLLVNFLQHLAPKAAGGDADAADLMQSNVTVPCRLVCCFQIILAFDVLSRSA